MNTPDIPQILLHHCRTLVTMGGPSGPRRGGDMRELGIRTDASLLLEGGRVVWAGPADQLDASTVHDAEEIDCTGKTVLPGFVDCHTHAMFGGSREDEFALRASGASYQEIAAAGGGILSTVQATRDASKRDLKRLTARRLDRMMRSGTTTVEIKSGYGLSEEHELKMLEALRELTAEHFATIVPTFLGAHAVPPEFAGDPDGYVRLIVERLLPYVGRKKLASFVDVFCEQGFFAADHTRRILEAAGQNGLRPRLHADQLSQSGASLLGVEFRAASVDHLEHIDGRGIAALAASETVGVLLPGASFFLGGPYAPARSLIDAGAIVALASNFNPGSCMSFSIPLMMTIACTQMRMTPEECLTAVTVNAAASLGLGPTHGVLMPGGVADVIVLDAPSHRSIAYEFGANLVTHVIKGGVLLEFPA